MSLGLIGWAISGAILRSGGPLAGDGVHVESYGFDLGTCLVPRETIAAAGMRKDAIASMVDPDHMSAEEASHRTYLVSGDRVIGVIVGGEARAYPILVANGHEIVNDTLGGVPIAVTYNPLCDSVMVFNRAVAGATEQPPETLEFGVSGLVCNSNLLMYDRRPPGGAIGESLWSQILGRAVAGPAAAAGSRLEQIPATLVTWAQWRAEHPETTVVARDSRKIKLYKQLSLPYEQYRSSDEIRFPVVPPPPRPAPPEVPTPKTPVVAVATGAGGWRVFSYPQIAAGAAASPDGRTWDSPGAPPLRFRYDAASDTVAVEDARTGEPVVATYCLWFAWHAMEAASSAAGQ